jgi:hypothetical protein
MAEGKVTFKNFNDLLHARMASTGANTEVLVVRNQKELKVRVDLSGKK